ncbi:Uncharacterized protein TCM_025504 [Theobroma cacao]|uniref:Uncharacterized protein n=1 Tax=Theobroma cacao TaxID=3641 RepID=A0A061EZB3_THECC|nr:Uncharacterized protein TCM_025504 [Theobroma cacao]
MIDPAVKGTLNVLRPCVKVPSIKRLIITSYVTAALFSGKPLADDLSSFLDQFGSLLNFKCTDEKQSIPVLQVSQERAKSLGVNFTPIEVSLKDTFESLKEKNFL